MKIKKFLEKAAEEDRESLINDKDIEFLASIGVDYNKKKEAAKKEPDASYYRSVKATNHKALFASIACFLIVAITVISLSLYFSLRPTPAPSPTPSPAPSPSPSPAPSPPPLPLPIEPPVIQYFDDNFLEVDSSLDELNADLELFSLVVDESEYKVEVKRTYDTLSGDDIFFTLQFTSKQGANKRFRFDIVVNKNYDYEEVDYADDLEEKQFSDYILKYCEISQPMTGTRFVNVECMGEIQIGEQWVYIINYKETTLGQSTFIDTLQSLISFK